MVNGYGAREREPAGNGEEERERMSERGSAMDRESGRTGSYAYEAGDVYFRTVNREYDMFR